MVAQDLNIIDPSRINRVLNNNVGALDQPLLFFVSGAAASGKTTVTKLFGEQVANSQLAIEQLDYTPHIPRWTDRIPFFQQAGKSDSDAFNAALNEGLTSWLVKILEIHATRGIVICDANAMFNVLETCARAAGARHYNFALIQPPEDIRTEKVMNRAARNNDTDTETIKRQMLPDYPNALVEQATSLGITHIQNHEDEIAVQKLGVVIMRAYMEALGKRFDNNMFPDSWNV